MTGFEPRTSDIGSNCSTNWATTTAQQFVLCGSILNPSHSHPFFFSLSICTHILQSTFSVSISILPPSCLSFPLSCSLLQYLSVKLFVRLFCRVLINKMTINDFSAKSTTEVRWLSGSVFAPRASSWSLNPRAIGFIFQQSTTRLRTLWTALLNNLESNISIGLPFKT